MKRIVAALCVAAVVLLPSPAAGQRGTPPGPQVRAFLSGFRHETGAATQRGGETGYGLGARFGYGLARGLSVFVEWEDNTIRELWGGPSSYTLEQTSVGARLPVGSAGSSGFVPYLEAAYSRLAAIDNEIDDGGSITTEYSGGGVRVGGGVQLLLRRSLVLDVGATRTQGKFTRTTDETGDRAVDVGADVTRLSVGLVVFFR